MHFDLSESERELLLNTLQDRLTALKVEVHRTDSREFREKLIGSQRTLEDILLKLGGGTP